MPVQSVDVRVLDTFPRRLTSTWRTLVKEVGAFGVVGAGCFVLDLGLFQLLYVGVGSGPVVAKLFSTVVAVTVAFAGHRYWSFSHRARTGIRREYCIFFLINGVALALGLAALAIAHHWLGVDGALALQVVNVGSIAAGTLIRFVAYRRWVFVAADAPVAVALGRSNRREHLHEPDAAPRQVLEA